MNRRTACRPVLAVNVAAKSTSARNTRTVRKGRTAHSRKNWPRLSKLLAGQDLSSARPPSFPYPPVTLRHSIPDISSVISAILNGTCNRVPVQSAGGGGFVNSLLIIRVLFILLLGTSAWYLAALRSFRLNSQQRRSGYWHCYRSVRNPGPENYPQASDRCGLRISSRNHRRLSDLIGPIPRHSRPFQHDLFPGDFTAAVDGLRRRWWWARAKARC